MNKEKINKILKITAVILISILILFLIWNFLIYPKIQFKKNEKELEKLGRRYYEVNYMYLPKQENRVISVSLDTLIKKDYTEGLYIKDQMCDIKASNVKTVNKNGKYEYYTYLKCGKYESKIDHEGPVITLNGKKEITLNKGETYKEEGVKEVVDNTDGKLDIKNVSIKGSVDTSKIGTYEITYTIKDSLGNKTVEIRNIKVKETLKSIIKNDTENKNYYSGNINNNYVMFNSMLFRIVKLNDKNITLVSDDPLANVDYTSNKRLKGSSIDKWLNEYFYNLLDEKYQKLIVEDTWCDDVITESEKATITECKRQSEKMKVGILSLQDYNKSRETGTSYLDIRNIVWYSNFSEDNKNYAMTNSIIYPNGLYTLDKNTLLNVRPAINIKDSTEVLKGTGTEEDPYIIVKESKVKTNSKLNERKIGEYITYSGYTFRISEILDDGNIEIIMVGTLTSDGNEVEITPDENLKTKNYNPNQKGSIGYIIKNDMTRYINTKQFVKTKIEVPTYNKKVTYNGKKETKTYNLKMTIPSTFDIFSAKSKNDNEEGFWLIESEKKGNNVVIRPQGTTFVDGTPNEGITSGVKIKAYLKNNTIIISGDGTINKPYKLDKK